MSNRFEALIFLILIGLLFTQCKKTGEVIVEEQFKSRGLQKLTYNNPDLIVDLDAGFKSVPMPMDFDGDGDYDLLISESGAYVEAGIFYFENISGNVEMPVFRRGMKLSFERRRLGKDGAYFQISKTGDKSHVLTPDRVGEKLLIYKNVPENVFWDDNEVILPEKGYDILHFYKNTYWKMIDFDGDGVLDLLCSAYGTRKPGLRGAGSKERLKAFLNEPTHDQLIFFKNTGNNNKPVYSSPVEITRENGESLTKGLNTRSIRPIFADYDKDGDLDYIAIGEPENTDSYDESWKKNFILYFENIGTRSDYKFTHVKVLEYKGKPIRFNSRSTINLISYDWNKDGYPDIIAGEESGRVSFLKNTGKVIQGIPQFMPPKFFQQEAKYVDFGALTAPRIYDWDGDGLDDIISGNEMGYIGFFKNMGGKIPKWDKPRLLEADGKTIRIIQNEALPNTEEPFWGYTTISVGNWNEDDLPDIIVNDHNGNVIWLKNIGTRTNPKLARPETIEVKWKGEPQKPKWTPGISKANELLAPWRTSPLIYDFNKDGLNDLVMLDYQGYISVYLRSEKDDKQVLEHPERLFVDPSGNPILLNQRTGSSSGRLKITLADWDGDGLDDLIFSSKPAVDWMKNLGIKDGKMQLQYMGRILSRTLMGHTDAPVVSDFNRDGIPDLLIGTEHGVFYYWQRNNINVTTTMTTTGKQKPATYKYFKR